jgi:hypothetical protein
LGEEGEKGRMILFNNIEIHHAWGRKNAQWNTLKAVEQY